MTQFQPGDKVRTKTFGDLVGTVIVHDVDLVWVRRPSGTRCMVIPDSLELWVDPSLGALQRLLEHSDCPIYVRDYEAADLAQYLIGRGVKVES